MAGTPSAVAPEVADAPHTARLRANLAQKRQVSESRVPTLDFAAFRSAQDAAARNALGARMFDAMRDIGFVILSLRAVTLDCFRRKLSTLRDQEASAPSLFCSCILSGR